MLTQEEQDKLWNDYHPIMRSMNNEELQEEEKKLKGRFDELEKKDPITKEELKEKEEISYKLWMINGEWDVRKGKKGV